MKQKLHITLLLITTLLFGAVFAQAPTYPAPANGRALVQQGGFSDIASTPQGADILKLSMLGIVQGGAGAKYRPAQSLTYQEAAAYLIRLLGYDEAALAKNNAKPNYAADPWAVGYMEQALAQGILTQEELRQMETLTKAQTDSIDRQVTAEAKRQWMTLAQRDALKNEKTAAAMLQNKSMKKPISRQNLALWIFRALNLQDDILTSITKDKYAPTAPISRAEAAEILINMIKSHPDLTGIQFGTARLLKINKNYNAQPTGDIQTLTYNMENFDGSSFDAKVETAQALPVIKGSKVYTDTSLKEGDTVEYALKDGQILYAALGDYGFVQGTLSYFDNEGNLRIEDSQKTITELKLGTATIITSLGKPAKDTSLIVGQQVKALNKSSLISRLDILEDVDYYQDTEYIDGIIKYIDKTGRLIKFEDYDGNLRTYGLDDRVIVSVNDYYENLDNLQSEQDATFEISGRKVKAIKAFTVPGEEVSKEYIAVLRVRGVEGDSIKVTPLENRQNLMTLRTDSLTPITYLGYPIKLYNIKVGDLVKIKANDRDKQRADSIDLMTKRQRVEKVYKAKILNTLPTQYRLALSGVQTYKYPDWAKLEDEKTFPVKRDAEIYKDGRKLKLEDLDKQRNTEAYIVTVKDFGEETIAKITLKSVSEDSTFSGSFGTEWTNSSIKLSDGQKLSFDDGTIIIKDRRLLDTSDLIYNKEAFVIKNKLIGGSNFAALISMENGNNFDYRNVVRGYIHDMGEDNFSLESYADLIDNDWQYYYDGENYFYLSKDSKILDNVLKASYITRDTFLQSRYKPFTYTIHDPSLYQDDNKPHYQRHKGVSHMLAYAVINEDGEATALNIYKKDTGLGRENITFKENLVTGEVVSSNITNTQLTLTDVKEYSKFYNQWQPTGSNTVLNTKKAIILKNEQVITLPDLDIGDKIYAITDQNTGIILFVE
ncbi:MAG: S-layer homology domain-containing protein [Bacteroidales bacterium]|nr:S-layer homology domain-containing protein [Bacteroidales bacterium]